MERNRQTPILRIASYNVRKARGLDQRRDPERIVAVIKSLGAQIVVLQEADRRLGERPAALSARLIEAETDFRVVPVACNAASLGWHGNAVLLHRSLTARSVSRIVLPGLEPRGAVRVEIEGGLTVVATHLGLLRHSRRRQLATIADALSDTPRSVIAGDFNEWRSDRGFEPLAARYAMLSPGRSFHAARPVAALDRLAHTRDLVVTRAGVDVSGLARRASDHLPIWADLAFQAEMRA
jgi:endonuclease/exonuclease/phosphatase family metal-dependent hydrolase